MPDATSSPAFPANKKNQPNPHPYSIKTTSSALLSWSNSSPSHSVQPVKHHYVPPSPTRARRGDASRDMSHRVGGNDMPHPPPLPTPPTVFSGSCSSFASTEVFSAPQRKRAETLPSGTVNSFMHTDDPSIRDGDLSSNPEEWTMEQLLTHLSTSFTMEKDTEMSSAGVMLDWVRKRGFTGWQWLRLTDTDVISMSLSAAQRSHLLENSHSLRTDVLRARLRNDSNQITDSSRGTHAPNLKSAKASPFHGDLYRVSLSSDNLSLPSDMDFSNPSSPSFTTIRRSNTVSTSSVQRYRDLARIRTRRRGKVQSLIETWEQARSRRGSIGSSETSGGEGSAFESDPEQFETSQVEESPSRDEGLLSTTDTTVIAGSPIQSYSPINSVGDDYEPSMEELLAYSGPVKGARAWEADIGLGETVKHVPASSTPDSSDATLRNLDDVIDEPGNIWSLKRGIERGPNMAETNSGIRKRVVTAVFTGTSETSWKTDASSSIWSTNDDDIEENLGIDVGANANGLPTALYKAHSKNAEHFGTIHLLETSLAHTRAELEGFKARLEAVEADLTRFETTTSAWQNSDFPKQAFTKDAQVSTDDATSAVEMDDVVEIKDLWPIRFDWRHVTGSVCARVRNSIYSYTQPIYHLKFPKYHEERLALLRAAGLPALRISSVIVFSFFLCAGVLRRVRLMRWLRKH